MLLACALLLAAITSPAYAAERFAYEHEAEEGNLWAITEEEEPVQLKLWGSSPTMDTRGRLIAYYHQHAIYVTDYKGKTVRKLFDLGSESEPGRPQWVPGRGLLSDGNGNIKFVDYAKSISTQHELGWEGVQSYPVPFPDGERLAFYSFTTPNGEPIEDGRILFVSNLDGSELEQVPLPESLAIQGAPTLSPDGTHIAFPAIGAFNGWENVDPVSLPIGGGPLTRLTDISERGLGGFGFAVAPDWLSDGRILFTEQHYGLEGGGYVTELRSVPHTGGPSTLVLPAYVNEQAGGIAGRQPVDWEPMTAESDALATRLMFLYAPTLKYDSLEPYRAVSVNSVFETYDGTEPGDSNALVNSSGTVIQYANPSLNAPPGIRIWLEKEGSKYLTDNVVADESHRLDERNGSYEEDAMVWQETPAYADRTYARAVYSEGQWWLQYWFWYYYNNFNLFGFGDHEGDWEMIQLGLGEYGNPQVATYAQHKDAEGDTCNFNVLDWTLGMKPNVSPVVYVARGTHASYVRPGVLLGNPPLDEAKGDGYVARLRPVEMFEMWGEGYVGGDYSRNWSIWPGRWGSSLGEGKSPMAPISQGLRFGEPKDFAEQAEGCPKEEDGSVQARRQSGHTNRSGRASIPPQPEIEAEMAGNEVNVTYRVASAGAEERGIEVGVSAEKPVVVPRVRSSEASEGVLNIPLPNGDGPYTITAVARDESGVGSAPVAAQLDSDRERVPQGSGENPSAKSYVAPSRFPISGSVLRHLSPSAINALRQRALREEKKYLDLARFPSPDVHRVFSQDQCSLAARRSAARSGGMPLEC